MTAPTTSVGGVGEVHGVNMHASPDGRVNLFGAKLDSLTLEEAAEQLLAWTQNTVPAECQQTRFVVTPNVDHVVQFQKNEALRAAYEAASLVLADGFPVLWASKLLRQPLPGLCPGSDLTPKIFELAGNGDLESPLRVYLLGAEPGVGHVAARNIHRKFKNVQVVGNYSPLFGFEKDEEENQAICEMINKTEPHVLVVGLGAPKQELWVHKHQNELHVPVTLCVGATIDFLAGNKQRAPIWMRRARLEWLHRLCSEPKRLAGRYAKDAWVFPQLVFKQYRQQARPMQ